MDGPLWFADACDIADLVRAGDVKAVEVLDVFLDRIGRLDPALNSFVLVDAVGARSQAEQVDGRVAAGEDPGPLGGVPLAVKDLEDVSGLPTGRGSLLFRDAVADVDSTQVARLRRAGAVVVGKTTTPELGSLNYTSSQATGVTRNPWKPERTPGGSSGGSAAAVAAGLVPLATGSDGGGSIRIPSAFCGLPGFKTTFGRVARGPGPQGMALASVAGPVARSARDIARYLDQVAGPHPMDPHSLPAPPMPFADALDRPRSGLRAAWSDTLGFGVCEPEVAEIARNAAERLIDAAGMHEVDVAVDLPDAGPSWAVLASLDAYRTLEPFWPDRAGELTPVVALTMQLAESVTPGQIAEAARTRHELLRRAGAVFEEADLLLTPTTPTAAFGADGPLPHTVAGRPLDNPLIAVCFTVPFNLTGQPAVSLPAGCDAEGMPVGLQVVGPRMSDASLIAVAALWERVSPWPPLAPGYA